MQRIIIAVILILAMSWDGFADEKTHNASVSHKRNVCNYIKKGVDSLLYENSHLHGATTTCSYTEDRLLIKSNSKLNEERMSWFVFLAFSMVGSLRNDDFMLPDKVYVGCKSVCQVLSTNDAAELQHSAKNDGDSGMRNARLRAFNAKKVSCPK